MLTSFSAASFPRRSRCESGPETSSNRGSQRHVAKVWAWHKLSHPDAVQSPAVPSGRVSQCEAVPDRQELEGFSPMRFFGEQRRGRWTTIQRTKHPYRRHARNVAESFLVTKARSCRNHDVWRRHSNGQGRKNKESTLKPTAQGLALNGWSRCTPRQREEHVTAEAAPRIMRMIPRSRRRIQQFEDEHEDDNEDDFEGSFSCRVTAARWMKGRRFPSGGARAVSPGVRCRLHRARKFR